MELLRGGWRPALLWAGLLVWGLAAASGPAAAAVDACPASGKVDLLVETLDTPVKHLYDRNTGQLTAMPGRGHGPQGTLKSAVLGLSSVRFGFISEIGAVFSLGPNATVCGRITLLKVAFGYQERTVLVARELPRGSCIHNEVLAHEMKHVAVDDAMLAEYVAVVRQRLEGLTARLGPVVSRSQNHAMTVMRGQVDRELESLNRDFSRERDRRQMLIDTLEEYRRVSDACDGEAVKYLKGRNARM